MREAEKILCIEWVLFFMVWVIGAMMYFYIPGFNAIHIIIGVITMTLSLTLPDIIVEKFLEHRKDAEVKE